MYTKNKILIKEENENRKTQFVILDDDPTGCQTVHGIDIYFEWGEKAIIQALETGKDFFILTNSRSVQKEKAIEICSEIGKVVASYTKETGRNIKLISRSDSTLRGHFLPEVFVLQKECGPYDGLIFCPYFKEGNRLTINDTHYIKNKGELIPVNETEFANDNNFGFKTAHLPSWIEEKSNGRWKMEDVVTITSKNIQEGVEVVQERLGKVYNFTPIVLNVQEDNDLAIIIQGIQKAEKEGKKFLYRTAASFVKVRLGIEDKDFFQPIKKKFGLVIAGSYVQKTTHQLNYLMQKTSIIPVEIKINSVLKNIDSYLIEKQTEIENHFKNLQSVLIFTQRNLYPSSPEESLKIGKIVMDFLTSLVNGLSILPEFVIAKGGGDYLE